MIVTRFHGRTGNQMFQYAVGRALSLKLGTSLALDDRLAIARGERSITRIFALDVEKNPDLPPASHTAKFAHFWWRYFGNSPRYVRENGLSFDPTILEMKDDVYLHGYWQSEKYFSDYIKEIRSDFAFPKATGRNAELIDEIDGCTSVSLHLRRGDYVANETYAVCNQNYYDRALKILCDSIPDEIHLYVFSDEPDWARQNLILPGSPVFVDHNGEQSDFEDMRLMSRCKHNIIANSSFSWWGAWLGNPAKRTVIAPKNWFALSKMSNPDIWAQGWTAI